MVVLVPINKDGLSKRTSTSLARYKMSTKLGRKLKKHEHVDHINEDKSDDTDDNLQILTPGSNNEKNIKHRGKTKRMVDLICPVCRKRFTRKWNQTHWAKKCGNHTTCSRSCSGKLANLISYRKTVIVRQYRSI